MKTLRIALAVSAVAAAALITACFAAPAEDDEETGSGESHIEEADPLEGAYEKQGGTPLHFVFKAGQTKSDGTFVGQIEDNSKPVHANGAIKLGRDTLGTTFTLTPSTTTKKKASTEDAPDASSVDGGAATDDRALVLQAFSGTMHYLKIGKNDTILVRGDTNGKTAQYKKIKSWCATADDCDPDVQKTSLDCTGSSVTCTSKSACACK
jgi:hypothetical protein